MSTKEAGNNLTRSFKISNPQKIKIACVISEWHSEITENLFIGVKKKLMMHGLQEKNIHEIHVPGSFELIKIIFKAASAESSPLFPYLPPLLSIDC